MSLSTTVAAMVSAGCSSEQIAAVVGADEARREADAETRRAAKRAGNAERQRRYRSAHNAVTERDGALCDVTARDTVSLSPEKEIPPTPPKEKLTPILSQTQGGQARGSRLPDDWRPNDDGRLYAVEKLGSNAAAHAEHAKFCDHWRAKAGADARKVDWDAAWRNWVRRAAEQQARSPPLRFDQTPRATIFDAARTRLENRNRPLDDHMPDDESGGIRRDPLRLLSPNGR